MSPRSHDCRSVKFWQDPHSVGCLRPSVPMASVVGEEIGTGDMKPMSDGFHSHARLINMEYRGILQERIVSSTPVRFREHSFTAEATVA